MLAVTYRPVHLIFHLTWIAAFCGYFAWMMTHHLDTFPGLHGDEAWFGLNGIKFMSGGANSLNGMNWYTGSLYSLSLAGIFNQFGADVFYLRILTVVANVIGACLMAIVLFTLFGPRCAFVALCLLGSSLYFLWYARVAWEVCTFNFLLLVMILSIILIILRFRSELIKTKWHFWSLLLFCLFWLGCFNHLIFVCVPLTLVVASILYATFQPTPSCIRLASLMTFGSLLSSILLLKRFVPGLLVEEHSGIAFALFFAFPVVWELLYWCMEPFVLRMTRKIIEQIESFITWITARLFLSIPQRKKWGVRLLVVVAVGPFVVDHGRAFFGILSNLAVMKRFVSLQPATIVSLLSWSFGALILFFLVFSIAKAWHAFRAGTIGTEAYGFLVLWFIVSFPLLPMILRGNSLRYYWLPLFLLIMVGAVGISYIMRNMKVQWMGVFLVPVLIFGIISFSEIERTVPRPPIHFSLGFTEETSEHFLPITPLASRLQHDNCCTLDNTSYFIDKPIGFLFASNPWPCDRNKRYKVEYCQLCEEDGFFRISVNQQGPAPEQLQ